MQKSKMGKGCCRFLALLVLFSVVFSSGVFAGSLDSWHVRSSLPYDTSGGAAFVRGIAYGDSTFVAVGHGGTVLTSSDGILWTSSSSKTTEFLSGIAYGNGTFVVVGHGGTILASSDKGVSWAPGKTETVVRLIGVTYGNKTFVVVGSGGTILTSSDGTSWEPVFSGTTTPLLGVTYGDGTFVVVGFGGTILASSDNGVSWTPENSGTTVPLPGVTYGNKTFVAVGEWGTVLTSSDGTSWEPGEPAGKVINHLLGVAYGNKTFVAVGYDGIILTSSDRGESWLPRTSGTTAYLVGATYGNNTFVAVGNYEIILQSDPVVFPIISVSPTNLNFDSVNVGASSSKTITIKNTGSANLVIGAVSTNSADFKSDTCYTQTIASGKSGEIKVVFSPKSEGSKTASLLIPSNDPYNSTVTVPLKGYGLPAFNQPPTVNLAAMPSSGQEPLKVNFVANAYDTDGVVVKYLWNFDGVAGFCDSYNTTGCSKVNYTYKKAGTYSPKVIVTDNDGATAEKSMTIKVSSPLLPDLAIGSISYSSSNQSLSVVIENIGEGEILGGVSIRVDVYVNKILRGYVTCNDGLKPNGGRKTITESRRLPSGRLGGIIDPKKEIKEVKETNNTWGNVPNSK